MSGVKPPSYGRAKSKAELVEQNAVQARSSRSDVPPWPKDDEFLKSRRQLHKPLLHKPLLSQFAESDLDLGVACENKVLILTKRNAPQLLDLLPLR
jgi:hypothetical protein